METTKCFNLTSVKREREIIKTPKTYNKPRRRCDLSNKRLNVWRKQLILAPDNKKLFGTWEIIVSCNIS